MLWSSEYFFIINQSCKSFDFSFCFSHLILKLYMLKIFLNLYEFLLLYLSKFVFMQFSSKKKFPFYRQILPIKTTAISKGGKKSEVWWYLRDTSGGHIRRPLKWTIDKKGICCEGSNLTMILIFIGSKALSFLSGLYDK